MALKAEEYIQMYEDADRRAGNFKSLWQDTGDYVYPTESGITSKRADGQAQTVDLVDTTAVFDAQDMASGLSSTLIPPGQPFFAIGSSDPAADDDDDNKQWLIRLTETTHEAIFGSNFVMQFDQFLLSWGPVFGEAAIFSERGTRTTLNFREYPAGTFHYLEDDQRIPDTFMQKFEFTARQAVSAWGKAGKLPTPITEAAKDVAKSSDSFEFVHVCQPRETRDVNAIDTLNMPWEDVYVSVQDKTIVFEGGFEEFPFHIGRWSKSSKESRGRGVGVFLLPQIRGLNQMKTDLIECANRHNNPPREIGEALQGALDVTPGANNYVSRMGEIKPLEGLSGNFPITREMVESERMEIHRAFLIDVFNQLMNLRGDRRTTLEIQERMNEGLRRLSQPAGRLIAEVLNPMLARCALILIRGGLVGPVPPGLQGRNMRIEYKSPLVLALKRHQAQAFMQWVSFIGQMEGVFPGVTDNVDADRAVRDMGDAFGVRADHKRSIRDRDAIRTQRAEQFAKEQVLEEASRLAQGYKQTTRAPEEGSLAGNLMGVGNA